MKSEKKNFISKSHGLGSIYSFGIIKQKQKCWHMLDNKKLKPCIYYKIRWEFTEDGATVILLLWPYRKFQLNWRLVVILRDISSSSRTKEDMIVEANAVQQKQEKQWACVARNLTRNRRAFGKLNCACNEKWKTERCDGILSLGGEKKGEIILPFRRQLSNFKERNPILINIMPASLLRVRDVWVFLFWYLFLVWRSRHDSASTGTIYG